MSENHFGDIELTSPLIEFWKSGKGTYSIAKSEIIDICTENPLLFQLVDPNIGKAGLPILVEDEEKYSLKVIQDDSDLVMRVGAGKWGAPVKKFEHIRNFDRIDIELIPNTNKNISPERIISLYTDSADGSQVKIFSARIDDREMEEGLESILT